MVILILAPNHVRRYNWGIQLFKIEIGRQHRVFFYGPGHKGYNSSLTVSDVLEKLPVKPDLLITFGYKYSIPFRGLNRVYDIPKIHFMIEYLPKWEIPYDNFLKKNNYDLILANKRSEVPRFEKKELAKKVAWMPFSVDTDLYRDRGLKRDIDVSFICSKGSMTIYPYRRRIGEMLDRMPIRTHTSFVARKQYIKVLNRSKIAVSNNSVFRYWSMRYTEIPACGTMLLANKAEDLDAVGMVDKEHFVFYTSLMDLEKKIKWYLEKDKERNEIAKRGMEFVRKNHSNEMRVQQLTGLLKEVL